MTGGMAGWDSLEFDREALLALAQRVREGVYFVDPSRAIRFRSRGAERISGYTAAPGDGPAVQRIPDAPRRPRGGVVREPLPAAGLRREALHGGGRVRLKHAQGARIPVHIPASAVLDGEGRSQGMVEVFRETSEVLAPLKRAEELESQALIDPLTGAGNRRDAGRVLEQAWQGWVRYGTHCGSALYDVDHFKRVNGEHGHDAGDEVLWPVARSMGGSPRAFDCLGRWGGEELPAVIQCVGAEDLKKVAARCRELGVSVRAPVGEAQVRVTLSAGVAAVGECRSVAEMLGLAGERLYLAKRARRNRAEGPPGEAEGAAEGEAAA